jgi:hypothetical protein
MSKTKTTPVQEEQKQIVLTQEQFDTLIKIYTALDEATDQISELANGEFNEIQLGYNLGMINNDLQRAYNSLDDLTDEINPNRNSWWGDDEDETDESK